MGRISRGWQLAKMSLGIIRKDKEILLFPVLSGIFTMLLLAGFIGGMFVSYGFDGMFGGSSSYVTYALLAVYYFCAFFITLFFNAAIIGCATIRLNGGDPTFKDGLRIARENVKAILVWALIAATVGVIIRSIQQRSGLLGKIIMGSIGVAWTIVTYFVVPVLIYEKLTPWKALKRSASIVKSAWGEALVGNLGLGAIFVLLGLAGVLFPLLGFVVGGLTGFIVGFVVAVIYWVALGIISTAAEAVLVAALYRYATTGKVAEDMPNLPFASPFTT